MEAAYVIAGVLGLLIGSFLNVVVWRVPRGESVASPPSACPRCGRRIRPWDNVPVVSWLVLRGRCRDCGEPIAVRYPVVELVTGVLFVLVTVRFGVSWATPVLLYLAAVGLALALIDLDVRRLPNAIVLPSYPVVAAGLVVASWNPGGTADWPALLRAVIGGVVLYGFYGVLMVVKEGAMGFGDVKLAGLLGAALAWVGWGTFAVGAFGAFVVGGLVAGVLMAAKRARLASRIPFGPWMVAGAVLGAAVGESVWEAYLTALT